MIFYCGAIVFDGDVANIIVFAGYWVMIQI